MYNNSTTALIFLPYSQNNYHCILGYQVRGLLPATVPLPVERDMAGQLDHDAFLKLVMKTYQSVDDHDLIRRQRKQAVLEAFHDVPRHVLYDLQRYFSVDCDLFNYSCSVNKRFNTNDKPKPLFRIYDAFNAWQISIYMALIYFLWLHNLSNVNEVVQRSKIFNIP